MEMKEVIVIGAGPYGLALGVMLKKCGYDFTILGKPMEFWHNNMPKGTILRSPHDWHIDPTGTYTMESYMSSKGLTKNEVCPLSLATFIDYSEWFLEKADLPIQMDFVTDLSKVNDVFELSLSNRETLCSKKVVCATGYKYFPNLPEDLLQKIPAGHYTHSSEHADFSDLKNRTCLIIGGRQSAYESAALMCEYGAKKVYISHRHEKPAFAPLDWSVYKPIAVENIYRNPSWWKDLSEDKKDKIKETAFREAKIKLEPWLARRIDRSEVEIFSETSLETCRVDSKTNYLQVNLSNGYNLFVDHIMLATGYKADIDNLSYLNVSIRDELDKKNGFPVLDRRFQSSVEGLYFTSILAMQDFGLTFGFVKGANVAAEILAGALR